MFSNSRFPQDGGNIPVSPGRDLQIHTGLQRRDKGTLTVFAKRPEVMAELMEARKAEGSNPNNQCQEL